VRADDADASSAWTPAVLRRDGVTVAVNAGGDPRRAKDVRDALDLTLDTLPAGPSRAMSPGDQRGHVALVGAGPGDPGLLTLRGRELLRRADVVVVDRLVSPELLALVPDHAEVVVAGKTPGGDGADQDDMNTLLIDEGRRGRRVVRLKGGDPYLFGRGGEEALACAAAGIDCDVVPGVTSAAAVPALAGIPLTHRGIADGVTVVNGHAVGVDWAALTVTSRTLVVLMGVGRIGRIATALLRHGRCAHTPVAVIERGATPAERVLVSTLERVAEDASRAAIANPAVIVIGEVVRLREALATTPEYAGGSVRSVRDAAVH
jgi:uroporphyrin-III C-methyltransferase/precorrin-2 dehydrogenase/sirohydrochlorin ferrochelatase